MGTLSSGTARSGRRVSRANSGPGATKISKPTLDSQAYELISLALLDEPANAQRDTMDEVALAELAESISKVGVIEPLVVERAGDRYRVIAGHRRLIACQIVKLSPVPCIVRAPGAVDPAAVTIAENYYREDVNPAEEAAFLDKLLQEKCGQDVDVLAALIRQRREYVEDRLLLLRGAAEVLDALRSRHISLAVARELNRVTDQGDRLHFLDAAIRGGASAAVVRTWRQGAETLASTAPAPSNGTSEAAPAIATVEPFKPICMFCSDSDDQHLMESVLIHRHCKKILARILDRSSAPAPEKEG